MDCEKLYNYCLKYVKLEDMKVDCKDFYRRCCKSNIRKRKSLPFSINKNKEINISKIGIERK